MRYCLIRLSFFSFFDPKYLDADEQSPSRIQNKKCWEIVNEAASGNGIGSVLSDSHACWKSRCPYLPNVLRWGAKKKTKANHSPRDRYIAFDLYNSCLRANALCVTYSVFRWETASHSGCVECGAALDQTRMSLYFLIPLQLVCVCVCILRGKKKKKSKKCLWHSCGRDTHTLEGWRMVKSIWGCEDEWNYTDIEMKMQSEGLWAMAGWFGCGPLDMEYCTFDLYK